MKRKDSGLLKKIKGKWVAVIVSGGIALGAGGVLANPDVLAQVNSSAISMMSTINSTNFENKDTYIQDKAIQEEAAASFEKITALWSFNTVEEVQQEINRQKEAGLDVYVVQWGDTLSVLAEATGTSVEDLADQNNISNWNLILTGDLLTGVLGTSGENAEISESVDQTTSADPAGVSTAQANEDDTNIDSVNSEAVDETEEGYSQDLIKQELNDQLVNTSGTTDQNEAQTAFFKIQEDIKFGTQYRPTEDLAVGEQRVVQEGKDGLFVGYYAEVTHADGSTEKSEVIESESESVAAVDRIIEVGTRVDQADDVETETNVESDSSTQSPQEGDQPQRTTQKAERTDVIPFKTVTKETDELLVGQSHVEQEGVDGEKTTTFELTLENGQEVDRKQLSEEITRQPVDEIVLIGTGEPEPEEQTSTPSDEIIDETIIDEVTTTPDETTDGQGEGEEATEGQGDQEPTEGENQEPGEGEEATEAQSDQEPTEGESQEPSEGQVDQDPSDDQSVETTRTRVVTQSIPFDVQYRDNDQLKSGEERVVQAGVNGIEEVTYVDTIVDDQVVSTEEVSREVTQEPVNQIIERGTRTVETKREAVREVIRPNIERRANANLNQGQERVIQEAQEGLWEVIYEVTYVNGEATSRVRTDERNVIEASKPGIVEYGTRQPAPAPSSNHDGVRVNNVQYTTSQGDTLESIARQFGTTAERIRRDNDLTSNSVSAGTPLVINNALAQPMDIPQSRDNRKVVMIDAGHGGTDPGATAYGRREKDINLAMSRRLRDELIDRGYEVQMVRDGDLTVKNINRSHLANDSDADIFVSIHQNASNGGAQGIETFYYRYSPSYQSTINRDYHNDPQRVTNSKHLAQLVQDNMIEETGAVNRGVKRASFQVLRETDIPAILIEGGFLDHRGESTKLASPAYQDRLMESVADAIDQYFADVHGQ